MYYKLSHIHINYIHANKIFSRATELVNYTTEIITSCGTSQKISLKQHLLNSLVTFQRLVHERGQTTPYNKSPGLGLRDSP